ncbi:MAG: DUF2231 domain-containing protein, partial [Candidatus Acidiferrales bacterium]
NYHPMFVHFPIALWLGALLFEFLAVRRASEDFHRTAARLLYLGTLAGAFTVMTGWWAGDSIPAGPAQHALEQHSFLMLTSFSLALGLCIFAFLARKDFTAQYRKWLLIGLVVLAVLTTIGADRGAQLVYQYGSSVNWPSALEQK